MFKRFVTWLAELAGIVTIITVIKPIQVYSQTPPKQFKPFFIHRQCPHYVSGNKYKAFTAYIQPGATGREVLVSLTYCSKKDEFRKSVGRSITKQLTPTPINSRHLNLHLAQAEGTLRGYKDSIFTGQSYDWVFKYLV